MTWLRHGRGSGDGPWLDQALTAAWDDAARAAAAVVDLDASLDVLLARSRQLSAQAGGAGGIDRDRLAAVLTQLDALLAAVTARTTPSRGPAHSVSAAGLFAAQRSLVQLRSGLARRAMSRDAAAAAAERVRHALEQAARSLGALPAAPPASPEAAETADVADAIFGWLGQLPGLQADITRLFDDTGRAAGLPVPVR